MLRVLARDDVVVNRALGKGLVRLGACDGFAALGYSCLANYASQRLGISGRSAEELAWMERRLEKYRATALAYDRGELTFSHVRLLLRAVRPEDELLWAWIASRLSVAQLDLSLEYWKQDSAPPATDEDVHGHPLRPDEDATEKMHRIECIASPGLTLKLELAVEIARREAGANLPLGTCMERFLAEFISGEGGPALGALPEADHEGPLPGEVLPWRVPHAGEVRRMIRDIRIDAAEFTNHWAVLGREVPSIPGPCDFADTSDPFDLDARMCRIQRLAHERRIHLMNLLAIVANGALHEALDFFDFGQYVEERLGMSSRTASFLLSLRRRLSRHPLVKDAFITNAITGAQAWLLTQVVTPSFEAAWIERARATTLKFLRQDVHSARRLRDLDPEWFQRTGGIPEQRVASASGHSDLPAHDAPTQKSTPAEVRDASPVDSPARLVQTCAPTTRVPRVQACAPTSPQATTVGGQQTCALTVQATVVHQPTTPDRSQACAPLDTCDEDRPLLSPAAVAWLPMRERLLLYRRGQLDALHPGPAVLLRFWLPAHLAELWRDAFRACKALLGDDITVADFIEVCVDAYLKEYAPQALADIRRHKVIHRDGWGCANPTCTRRLYLHVHHVEFRSQGGSSDEVNLTTLCRQCHLRLLHLYSIRVSGEAPHNLVWQLGRAPDGSVHLAVEGRRIVTPTSLPRPAPDAKAA